jgi:ATP-binding cassette, subfamily B, multidrug efflux pump
VLVLNEFEGIWPYIVRHRRQWIVGFLCILGSVSAGLAGPPYIVGLAIDALRTNKATPELILRYAGLILLTAGFANTMTFLMRRFIVVASRQIAYEVRRDIYVKLTTLDQGYFHRNRTGDLMNRLTGDLGAVMEMLGFGVNQGANTMLTLIISLALMISLSPTLGLVVLAIFPVIAVILVFVVRIIGRRHVAVQEQASLISAKAQENFSGIRVVKGYAIEDREIKDYKTLNLESRRRVMRLAMIDGPLWALVGFLMNLVFVAVLLFGARQLIVVGPNGSFAGLTIGQFVQFTTYLFNLQWPMLAVGVMASIFQRGASSWKRLQEILEVEPEIEDNDRTDRTITGVEGTIRFEGVGLKVGDRTLLDHVTLDVPKGTTLGITGRTGSGKTLLASLVGRMMDPTTGRVLVDGQDVREIPLEALRRNIGYVPQEPFLFSDTIAENIAFGLPESTQVERDIKPDPERIHWAARVAGLAKDIEDFPLKYETMLGERGVTLSGGQRQRTALARAVARKPNILILDDSMSAVDTETESRILNELKLVLEDRTVFLIGHRVSTLRYADHIIVLENGRIAEQGSHDKLIAQGGIYAEMDRKQGLEEAIENAPEDEDVQPDSSAEQLKVSG